MKTFLFLAFVIVVVVQSAPVAKFHSVTCQCTVTGVASGLSRGCANECKQLERFFSILSTCDPYGRCDLGGEIGKGSKDSGKGGKGGEERKCGKVGKRGNWIGGNGRGVNCSNGNGRDGGLSSDRLDSDQGRGNEGSDPVDHEGRGIGRSSDHHGDGDIASRGCSNRGGRGARWGKGCYGNRDKVLNENLKRGNGRNGRNGRYSENGGKRYVSRGGGAGLGYSSGGGPGGDNDGVSREDHGSSGIAGAMEDDGDSGNAGAMKDGGWGITSAMEENGGWGIASAVKDDGSSGIVSEGNIIFDYDDGDYSSNIWNSKDKRHTKHNIHIF